MPAACDDRGGGSVGSSGRIKRDEEATEGWAGGAGTVEGEAAFRVAAEEFQPDGDVGASHHSVEQIDGDLVAFGTAHSDAGLGANVRHTIQ